MANWLFETKLTSKLSAKPQWGLGLRHQHFKALEALETLPLLEIMTDNHLFQAGGPGLRYTEALAERTTPLLHGIGLNIGGTDALDDAYLRELARLVEVFHPLVVSDHLCFTRSGGRSSYELLPIPRNSRFLGHVAERVCRVQDVIGRRLCLENISAYVGFRDDEISEGEFFSELVRRTGCGLLLDINNLFVNAFNFDRDAVTELAHFPMSAVQAIHVAGYTDHGTYLFDTHDQPTSEPVVRLLKKALASMPGRDVPVVLEWDESQAPLETLLSELSALRCAIEPELDEGNHAYT